MERDEHQKAQPLRELEWLARYFIEHGREDLAEEIFAQLKSLRHRAQDSLGNEGSEVINFTSIKHAKHPRLE